MKLTELLINDIETNTSPKTCTTWLNSIIFERNRKFKISYGLQRIRNVTLSVKHSFVVFLSMIFLCCWASVELDLTEVPFRSPVMMTMLPMIIRGMGMKSIARAILFKRNAPGEEYRCSVKYCVPSFIAMGYSSFLGSVVWKKLKTSILRGSDTAKTMT